MSKPLDLNADLGEGCAFDADLMPIITSCNIACGGHTGDETTMRAALELARLNGVSAGAHPSFPDRENFGRSPSNLSGPKLESVLSQQVQDLLELAAEQDIVLSHLKPHGALYNMAAKDAGLATSILAVLKTVIPEAALFGPPSSELETAAKQAGVRFVPEGFADRAYEADGSLRSRTKIGALLEAPEDQAQQAIQMATKREVTSYNGEIIPLTVETICVHGDSPNALAAAQAIKAALARNGLDLCPPR